MKKFAYFAALSVVIIAQAGPAQAGSGKPIINEGWSGSNRPVTLKEVTLSTPTAATVILSNGERWSFRASSVATVAGIKVSPSALKVGMNCIMSGVGEVIHTLACK